MVILLNLEGMYTKGIDEIWWDSSIDNLPLVMMVIGPKTSHTEPTKL
jgi:hypothetical protein